MSLWAWLSQEGGAVRAGSCQSLWPVSNHMAACPGMDESNEVSSSPEKTIIEPVQSAQHLSEKWHNLLAPFSQVMSCWASTGRTWRTWVTVKLWALWSPALPHPRSSCESWRSAWWKNMTMTSCCLTLMTPISMPTGRPRGWCGWVYPGEHTEERKNYDVFLRCSARPDVWIPLRTLLNVCVVQRCSSSFVSTCLKQIQSPSSPFYFFFIQLVQYKLKMQYIIMNYHIYHSNDKCNNNMIFYTPLHDIPFSC